MAVAGALASGKSYLFHANPKLEVPLEESIWFLFKTSKEIKRELVDSENDDCAHEWELRMLEMEKKMLGSNKHLVNIHIDRLTAFTEFFGFLTTAFQETHYRFYMRFLLEKKAFLTIDINPTVVQICNAHDLGLPAMNYDTPDKEELSLLLRRIYNIFENAKHKAIHSKNKPCAVSLN